MITTTTRAKARKALPRRRPSSLLGPAQILLAALLVSAAIPKLAGRTPQCRWSATSARASGCATWSGQLS